MPIQLNDQGEKVKSLHVHLKPLGYTIPPEELKSSVFGKVTKAACAHYLVKLGINSGSLQDKGILDDASLQAIVKTSASILAQPLPPYSLLYGTVSGYEAAIVKTKMNFLFSISPPTLAPVPIDPNKDIVREQGPSETLQPGMNQKVISTKTDNDGFYAIFLDPGVTKATIQLNQSLWKEVAVGRRFNLLLGIAKGSKGKEVKALHKMLYNLGYLIPQEELKAEICGGATESALLHFNPQSNITSGDLTIKEYEKIKKLSDQQQTSGKDPVFFSLVLGRVSQVSVNVRTLMVEVFNVDVFNQAHSLSPKRSVNSEGNYFIYYSYTPQGGKQRPTLKVMVSDPAGKEIASSSLIYQAKNIEMIRFSVEDSASGNVSEFDRVALNLAPFMQTILNSSQSLNEVVHLTAETGIESKKIFFFIHAINIAKRADKLLATGKQIPSFVFYGLFSQDFALNPLDFLQREPNDWQEALEEAQAEGIIPVKLEPSLKEVIDRLNELKIAWIASESDQLKNVFPDENARKAFLKELNQISVLNKPDLHPVEEQIEVHLVLSSLLENDAKAFASLKDQITTFKDLASKGVKEWKTTLKSVSDLSLSDDIPGTTKEEKIGNYAEFLVTSIKAKFPQKILLNRLESFPNSEEAKEVTRFLTKNPKFNFQRHHIDTFLNQIENHLEGFNKPILTRSLKKLQRLAKLSIDPDEIMALQGQGFQSAYEITELGQTGFVQKMGSMSSEKALRLYEEAQQQAVVAHLLLARNWSLFNYPDLSELPSWEQMFGSLELCHCEDCYSIYSPSAYLVDILEFLSKRKASQRETTFSNSKSVKDLLFDKRPDLGETELSCENTLTSLPYIDLVNEILEDQISPSTAKRKRTTRSTEELALEPEYLNETVYKNFLTKAYFPFRLPFDLPLEEVRLYLQRLGTSRKELLEQFNTPYSLPWICEALGLSLEEQNVILGIQTSSDRLEIIEPLKSFWGINTGYETLSKIPLFLEKSGLTFEQTQVIAKLLSIEIVSSKEGSCDLSEISLQENGQPLSIATLTKVSHILRLWRKLVPQFGEEAPFLTPQLLTKLSSEFVFQDFFQIDQKTLNSILESGFFAPLKRTSGRAIVAEPTLEGLSLETLGWIWLLSRPQNPRLPSMTAWDLLIASDVLKLFNSSGNEKTQQLEHIALFVHLSQRDVLPTFNELIEIKKLERKDRMGCIEAFKTWEKLQNLSISIQQFKVFSENPFLLEQAQTRLETTLDLKGLEQIAYWEELKNKNESPYVLGIDIAIEDLLNASSKETTDPSLLDVIKKAKQANRSGLLASLFQARESYRKELGDLLTALTSMLKKESVFIEESLTDAQERLSTTVVSLTRIQKTIEMLQALESRDESSRSEREQKIASLEKEQESTKKAQEEIKKEITLLESKKTIVESFFNQSADLQNTPLKFEQKNVDDFRASSSSVIDSKETVDLLLGYLETKFQTSSTGSWMKWVMESFDLSSELAQAVARSLNAFAVLADTNPKVNDLLAKWKQMYQAAQLAKMYSLSSEMVEWICKQPPLNNPSESLFQDQVELLCAMQAFKDLGDNVLNVLRGPEEKRVSEIAKLLDVKESEIGTLDNRGLGRQILEKRAQVRLLQKGGFGLKEAQGWIESKVSFAQANALKTCLKRQNLFSSTQNIRDELRQKQRDALIAYLLSHPPKDKAWKEASDLYDYFLIDVEMNAFQKTSRIKQAISTVQLFVQKSFMGLEEKVNTSVEFDQGWEDWKQWMFSYRVWEANRKVFLYPENWVEPELRDNKSSFFEEFEKELQQDTITAETADAAFTHYLEKVDHIAHLDICGMFHQKDQDGQGRATSDILHVFGRNFSRPHTYYYRRKDNKIGEWSAWEKVDLDIEGDHLLPVVWNNRLYLFWPIVTEKSKAKEVKMPTEDKPLKPPPKKREIRLAWSEYKEKKWSSKQISIPCIRMPTSSNIANSIKPFPKSKYAFRAIIQEDTLNIVCTLEPDPNHVFRKKEQNKGSFEFLGRVGNPSLNGKAVKSVVPLGTVPFGMQLSLHTTNHISMPPISNMPSHISFTTWIGTIGDSKAPLKILLSYQGLNPNSAGPLFLKGSHKTFFVEWRDKPQLIEDSEWRGHRIEVPKWMDERFSKLLPPDFGYPSDISDPVINPANLETILNRGGF